ncbi:unnamed protein product [Effrenium voratum]|nr:unnamed protein product [Effrenium voratum]
MEELEETLDVDVAALPQKATKVPQDPGETPIFRLLRLGLLQKAEVALRKLGQMPTGLAVNAREEKFEWGLLHFAAHKGEVGLLDWLLRQKARPDMADGEGNTPLVLCAKSNHVQAMEMLMARGAPRRWERRSQHRAEDKGLRTSASDALERLFLSLPTKPQDSQDQFGCTKQAVEK